MTKLTFSSALEDKILFIQTTHQTMQFSMKTTPQTITISDKVTHIQVQENYEEIKKSKLLLFLVSIVTFFCELPIFHHDEITMYFIDPSQEKISIQYMKKGKLICNCNFQKRIMFLPGCIQILMTSFFSALFFFLGKFLITEKQHFLAILIFIFCVYFIYSTIQDCLHLDYKKQQIYKR